jgi:hypothetical protein
MAVVPSTRANLLLRLCDPRDHDAWLEFLTLCEPVVYRLLRQRGLADGDARQLVQDLFLAVSMLADECCAAPASRGGREVGHVGRNGAAR